MYQFFKQYVLIFNEYAYLCILLIYFSLCIHFQSLIIKEENESFLFDIGLTWIMAKSLSFMCDRINLGIHKHITVYDFSVIVSYCLYLPSVFTGPVLSYEYFVNQVSLVSSYILFKFIDCYKHNN